MREIAFTVLTIGAVGFASLVPTDLHAGSASSAASFRSPGSKITLNPQPLPPKAGGLAQRGIIIVGGKGGKGSDVMLNPQPLPPKAGGLAQRGIIIVGGKGGKGSDVMLNPQPLPPKAGGLAQRGIIIVGGKGGKGSDVMLNPQPLPPKAGLLRATADLHSNRHRLSVHQ